jgi:hypothetical protein
MVETDGHGIGTMGRVCRGKGRHRCLQDWNEWMRGLAMGGLYWRSA